MQIYTNNKKIESALKQKEIQELLSYFHVLPEPVILREIRKNFPQQTHLDKNLDMLIDNGIILRQSRRYQFCSEVVVDYPTTDMVKHFIQRNTETYSTEQLLVWLGEKLWSDNSGETLIADIPFPTCNRLVNESFHLVTINCASKLTETLPNYFENISRPKLFPQLSELIGDVNPDFFNNQIGLIIERIMADKSPRRDSIFLESLLNSGVIEKQPDWRVLISVYNEDGLLDLVQELDARTQFLFARQLAEELLGGRESFTYLIKKKA
ncbi:DUF1803 domain-containing protein [Enterococcus malodoratus]|uniref:DUF1803 domain-containing protein n=1 Tax=Enterococcus malodoratus TaxID=71451 RepID=UPI0039AEE0B2